MKKESNVEEQEKKESSFKKSKKVMIIAILAIIVVALILVIKKDMLSKEQEAEIMTESSLYKIINVSELSTYQCIYNDVCVVMDEKKTEKVDFYCAYEAKVNAGIDFEQIEIDLNEDTNTISVTVPKVNITDVNVDVASLDYMFEDDSANTNTVSELAYKACIADVTEKSKKETKIYDLAQQNAENIIKALIQPFIEQLDAGYILEINTAEEE